MRFSENPREIPPFLGAWNLHGFRMVSPPHCRPWGSLYSYLQNAWAWRLEDAGDSRFVHAFIFHGICFGVIKIGSHEKMMNISGIINIIPMNNYQNYYIPMKIGSLMVMYPLMKKIRLKRSLNGTYPWDQSWDFMPEVPSRPIVRCDFRCLHFGIE